ncbi:E6 protein [Molossus molossus papillomavirus type 2]|nr:E6 protein [Molossus molossus papillomavirus type 2]
MAVFSVIKRGNLAFLNAMASGGREEVSEVSDAFSPRSIHDLCEQRELSISSLLLPCCSCLRLLSIYEKILFDLGNRCLVYQDGIPFGLCQTCLFQKSKIEFLTLYEKTLTAPEVERETGYSIFDLSIRCLKCQRFLCYQEKVAVVQNLEAFQKISKEYRALCSMCRVF